jgi:hypothetical protein
MLFRDHDGNLINSEGRKLRQPGGRERDMRGYFNNLPNYRGGSKGVSGGSACKHDRSSVWKRSSFEKAVL